MLKTQVIGNLGKDAEVKEVNGKKVIEFSVCHSYKKQGGESVSVWVNCSKWGDTTTIAPYLKKGTKVWCDGTPSVDAWIKDGEAKSSLRLSVSQIELLGGNSESAPAGPIAASGGGLPAGNTELPETTSDLPF